jgi:predicted AAA+ superfamily ATPase
LQIKAKFSDSLEGRKKKVYKIEPLDFDEFLGILHNTKKQIDSSNTQNSKDNRIPLPLKVI